MRRIRLLAFSLIAVSAVYLSAVVGGQAASTASADPGILMGAPQWEHWEGGSAECKDGIEECSDEISQGQFVAWPFVAEHTGTVDAIFAVLDGSNYGTNTGSEVGIYANRIYHYAEIVFDDGWENEKGGCSCTWTAADFMKYESEIPPEDPGALLGTSGKVAESNIEKEEFTEFKLEHPVKVVKGVKYWLANTTFQNYPLKAGEAGHVYQRFVHERESHTEGQPWGVYSNEPSDWEEVARPLKELPSPETTKINCEECDTEGWLQEEPKGEHLTNSNREGQEEGGQTFSYAYGEIEEGGTGEEAPSVGTGAASGVGQSAVTLNGSVDPNGGEVTACRFEYGPTVAYGSSVACATLPGSGTSPVAVSADVTGLDADGSYHYRLVATNASGTGDGGDEAFRTLPLAPSVGTGAASGVGQSAVTLNGSVDPNGGEVTACRFEYGPTVAYGSSVACATLPGSGTSPVAVSADVTGLDADGSYHYRLVATNASGTGDGGDEAFRTLPLAPSVGTGAASGVGQSAVTLNGSVDPNGGEVTACRFEYGPTVAYGSSVACATLPGSGTSPVAVSADVTGLDADGSYHYRLVATNASGTGDGGDEAFRTLPLAPSVGTGAASGVGQSAVTLNGSVDPNGGEVTACRFEYGPTVAYGSSVACATLPGSGTSPVAVSADVTGLDADGSYHYRLVATNASGTGDGGDEAFRTLPLAPSVGTGAASGVGQSAVTLNGSVDPNGGEVTACRFEYGPTVAYGSSVACATLPGSGTSPVAVSADVTGLDADGSYHYRLVATNASGTGDGGDEAFRTLPLAPSVGTGAASGVGQSAVTLNGSVDPNGGEVTACRFEYGPTVAYGSSVACATLPGSGTSPVAVSADVTGLDADGSYHYRLVATNASGTGDGGDEAFRTLPLAPSVGTGAASGVGQSAVTLNGSVDPNGGEVTACRFEYGPTVAYGSSVACATLPGSGTSPVAVSAAVSGLVAGTSYYYRLLATNGIGTSMGEAQSFTTQLPTTLTEQGPDSTAPPIGGNTSPPPVETTPPPVPDAQLVTRALTAGPSGVLVAKISCPVDETSCEGVVTLKTLAAVLLSTGVHSTAKPKATVLTLARGSFAVAGGQAAATRLRLSASARTLLARAHAVRARATLVAHDPAGATHTSQALLTIAAAKATHKRP